MQNIKERLHIQQESIAAQCNFAFLLCENKMPLRVLLFYFIVFYDDFLYNVMTNIFPQFFAVFNGFPEMNASIKSADRRFICRINKRIERSVRQSKCFLNIISIVKGFTI